jgi:hypothetical protein
MSTITVPRPVAGSAVTGSVNAEVFRQVHTLVRYWTCLWILTYGFAKVFGTQFYTLLSDLDTPLGQIGGFRLLWHYFDYSPGYTAFVAAGELLGGLLLLFRRTSLAGALLLLPILANVAVVDVAYQVVGVLPVTLMLLGGVVFLLLPWRGELKRILWDAYATVYPPAPPRPRVALAMRWPVRLMAVAVPMLFIGVFMRNNTRHPTSIDGKWAVASRSHAGTAASVLDSAGVVYFEPRFAGMAVLQTPGGRRETRFTVDERARTLKILSTYSSSGPAVFEGSWALDGNTLRLSGKAKGDAVSLVLTRAAVAAER